VPAKANSSTKTRDAERTKKRLLDSAESMFAMNGLDGASTEEIARRAGVSKTMLFYYFHNKEQLYVTVLKRLFEAVVDPRRSQEIDAMEPTLALKAIVLDYFDIHQERPSFAELTLREAMTYGGKHLKQLKYDMPFVGQLMRILRRGELSGAFRPVDPYMTTMSIVGITKIVFTYRKAMERILERDVLSPGAIKEWRTHIVDLLLNGIVELPAHLTKPAAPPHGKLGSGYDPERGRKSPS